MLKPYHGTIYHFPTFISMTIPMTQKAAITALVDTLDRQVSPHVTRRALQAAGLTRDALNAEPGFLPTAVEAVMLESAARSVGDPHLGLRLGSEHAYEDLGWYAAYVLAAPQLISSFARGKRALPFISPGCGVSFRRAGEHVVLSYQFNLGPLNGARQLEEGMPGLLTDLVRRFAGTDWHPDWIEMPGSVHRRSAVIEDFYGAPVRFGASAVGIALHRSVLGHDNPNKPDAAGDLLIADLPSLLGIRPPVSVSDQVLTLLATQLRLGDSTIDTIAARLAVGTRTLERQLRAEGTSFRDLKQHFLRERAMALLATGDWSVTAVAKALGYSEPNSFSRAFTRWTGHPPSTFAYGTKTAAPE
ncbi:MAG: AraC family transcriptional regulator ligand-binding domain-containing protein [Rhodobacteraceae bacterium]|nr:AraC family transcriptional regulator ligand-binding domain-containing protein [Paracoccaceae bacterium]